MVELLFFSLSSYEREVDKWKKSHKCYSCNDCEALEIDNIPYISKNLLWQYVLGLPTQGCDQVFI